MKIDHQAAVTFHYTLRDEEGTDLESSRSAEPSAYLHGANNIITGLESAMTGRTAGDIFSVTLAPADAYGMPQADKVQRVPVKHLVFKGKLRPGLLAKLNTSQGMVPVTVTKAGRHSADVDTNHPLAGKTLTFDIEIMDVRAASAEEVSHGHVHGPGGHQH